mmetsp:Transcript_25057/g.45133  ORF Transcript_25057/g.45133 Transcript_25057/m.45133 type:complete len:92 (+) Transcript_25057:527-802(+)
MDNCSWGVCAPGIVCGVFLASVWSMQSNFFSAPGCFGVGIVAFDTSSDWGANVVKCLANLIIYPLKRQTAMMGMGGYERNRRHVKIRIGEC